jgi:hypothetical protein
MMICLPSHNAVHTTVKRCAFTNLQTSKRSKAISADGKSKGQLTIEVGKRIDALKDKPHIPCNFKYKDSESLKTTAIFEARMVSSC